MIAPKPLTTHLQRILETNAWIQVEHQQIISIIRELIAAEAYWREAVKQMHDEDYPECPFCEKDFSYHWHAPDCPWLLAQE